MLRTTPAITALLMLLPVSSQAEFPNPGRYGGFVPPHELERLQNLDPQNPAVDPESEDAFDPYFSVDNDPWNKLPSPFDRPDIEEVRKEMREEAQEMRSRAQRFISERELEMLENPPMMMRYGGPTEAQNVWGDLNAADDTEAQTQVVPPAPMMPGNGAANYPYGGYVPQTPQWQSVVPGFSPGYSPGYGGGYPRGYNSGPYMYPAAPSPYMMNSIAPFLY